MENYVITIARGFGSGGKAIGTQLAEELGINCYAQQLIDMASEYSGINKQLFVEVDEKLRGQHIGRELYEYVLSFAKEEGCHNLTLNVWACNPAAMRFYESCGLSVQKIGMEQIL